MSKAIDPEPEVGPPVVDSAGNGVRQSESEVSPKGKLMSVSAFVLGGFLGGGAMILFSYMALFFSSDVQNIYKTKRDIGQDVLYSVVRALTRDLGDVDLILIAMSIGAIFGAAYAAIRLTEIFKLLIAITAMLPVMNRISGILSQVFQKPVVPTFAGGFGVGFIGPHTLLGLMQFISPLPQAGNNTASTPQKGSSFYNIFIGGPAFAQVVKVENSVPREGRKILIESIIAPEIIQLENYQILFEGPSGSSVSIAMGAGEIFVPKEWSKITLRAGQFKQEVTISELIQKICITGIKSDVENPIGAALGQSPRVIPSSFRADAISVGQICADRDLFRRWSVFLHWNGPNQSEGVPENVKSVSNFVTSFGFRVPAPTASSFVRPSPQYSSRLINYYYEEDKMAATKIYEIIERWRLERRATGVPFVLNNQIGLSSRKPPRGHIAVPFWQGDD